MSPNRADTVLSGARLDVFEEFLHKVTLSSEYLKRLKKRFIKLSVIMPQIVKKSRPDLYPVKDQCNTGIIGGI
jgi:hypothetical protein